MKKSFLFIWPLILLASWSCRQGEKTATSSERAAAAKPFSTAMAIEDIFPRETEAQLELTSESALAYITDMAVDAKGNFIISDGVRLNRVWIFSPSGKFLQKLGEQGQGLGEYAAPLSVAVNHEGEILVNDYFGMKIIFYDREYRYERDLKAIRGRFIHVNSKDEIYLYEGMIPPVARGVFDTIKELDQAGKLILSFAPLPEDVLKTHYSVMADGMDIDKDDFIYEMNSLYYSVRKYTPGGKLIKSFTNPNVRSTAKKDESPPIFNGPYGLENGLVLVQREKKLDLFDNEGNLIVSGIPLAHKIIHARGNAVYLEAWEEAGQGEKQLNPKIICYQIE